MLELSSNMVTNKQTEQNHDPLVWWRGNSSTKKLPFLRTAAQAILCIPASSAPVERLFSTAGDVYDYRRTNLSDENMEALVMFHENFVRKNNIASLSALDNEGDSKDIGRPLKFELL